VRAPAQGSPVLAPATKSSWVVPGSDPPRPRQNRSIPNGLRADGRMGPVRRRRGTRRFSWPSRRPPSRHTEGHPPGARDSGAADMPYHQGGASVWPTHDSFKAVVEAEGCHHAFWRIAICGRGKPNDGTGNRIRPQVEGESAPCPGKSVVVSLRLRITVLWCR